MANRDRTLSATQMRVPIVAVGAVIWNGRGEVLLVRRGRAPRQNEWSIPGGKIEWGETVEDSLLREVREETGLTVKILGLIAIVDSLIPGRSDEIVQHHVLLDFTARRVSGKLRAGDDARAVCWVPLAALKDYPMWNETRRIIVASAASIPKGRKQDRQAPRARRPIQ